MMKVALDLDALPPPDKLQDLLANEVYPFERWFDFARGYLAAGEEEAFIAFSTDSLAPGIISEIQKINGGERPAYQEIQFHCGLAQLKMMQSKREVATVEKQRLLSQAGDHLMDARKVDNSEQLVHLGLGMLYAAKGDLKLARDEFLRATKLKNNGKTNISGYLALAALSYSKNPKEALALYRQALKESPGCPSEVRLGIGACLLKIGDVEGAKAAFNRVITLDPSCPDAHLGLAVIKFANSNLQQGLADGMKLLLRAYELDPTHAGTLSLLAHYSLLRGDYDRSCSLSRAAVDACDIDFFKAESFCTLGRAQHAMGRIIDAQKAYINATRLDPLMALPHLGIAQHWLAVGSSNINAIGELERAIQLSPSFYEALRILGELSFDQSATKLEKILPSFREAAARREGDADIWELLGELLAQSDPSGSTKAYEHALSIHKKKREESLALRDEQRKAALALHEAKKKQKGKKEEGADLFGSDDEDDDPKVQNEEASKAAIEASLTPEHTIPPRLLNNAAVLLHRAGRTSEALRLMQDARDSLTQSTGLEFLTTLSYNIARLQEALGEIRQSTAEYKAILAKSPQYVDCYLRLSCIARRMGSLNEAIEWANKAMEIGESGDPNAIALLSQLHMDRRDYKSANDMIKMLQDARMQAEKRQAASGGEHKFDSYARIASGNLQLATAPIDRKKPEDAKKAEEKLMKAYMEYQHVLRGEPNNVFAANGIGAVLAELGRLDEAREIFQEVQAAVAASQGFVSIPDLYINLANVSLASQEYADSLNLYRVAMERLDASKQSQVLLYQARSAYDSGDYKIAKHFLLRAVHVAPLDYNLRFNAAVTMQQSAVRTYTNGPKRDAGDVSKLSDYRQAQEDLKQAKTYFEDLLSKGTEITKIDKARLSVHVKYCTEHFEKSEVFVTAAEEEAQLVLNKRSEEAAKKAQADALKMKEAAERRKAEEEKKKALNEQTLSEYDKKRQDLMRKWKETGAVTETSKKRKSKGSKSRQSKVARTEGGDLGEEEDEEMEEAQDNDDQVDPNVLEENLFEDEELEVAEEEEGQEMQEGGGAAVKRLQRNDDGADEGEGNLEESLFDD